MFHFSLRITHFIKIGFYSFPENPNFVFSKGSVDARDSKIQHCPENDNTLLTALLYNSLTVCSSIYSSFLPISLLPLRVKCNYQLRNHGAAANSDFSLSLFMPSSKTNGQEFFLLAELFVFLCHICCSHCICAYLFFSLLSTSYVGGKVYICFKNKSTENV